MPMVELGPAAKQMADLIEGVPDELLGGAPTPCLEYTLGDLVDHIRQLTIAFTAAAKKDTADMTSGRAPGEAKNLGDDWRTRIPRDLAVLAEAWREPAAWTGMTMAGGIDLPGELAGIITLTSSWCTAGTWPGPPDRTSTRTGSRSRRCTGS